MSMHKRKEQEETDSNHGTFRRFRTDPSKFSNLFCFAAKERKQTLFKKYIFGSPLGP
nr:hypothetical protein Iba_chr08cCG4770 [Ipomoea batatas]